MIYIDIDELDVPLNFLNSTLIDSVLLSLHNNETDIFTCTTYSNRLLNGCLITRQSLIREILTKTTMSKGKLDVLDYVPLYFKEMNRELKVESMMIRDSLSPYLNVKDKLIPTVFGCDLSENDTSFTVSVTTYKRPKLYRVLEGFDKQDLQPKQVVMIQNTDRLHWNSSLFVNRKTHYYHIWCSNWNSGYTGKYHPGLMFDTTFNYIIDDDVFISYSDAFKLINDGIRRDNSLYGMGCAYYKKPEWEKSQFCLCDHVYWVIYPRIKHLKLLFQTNIYTHSGGEDIQISLQNYLSCLIEARRCSISIKSSQGDEYMSYYDRSPPKESLAYNHISIPIRTQEQTIHGYYDIYNHYIQQGFIPIMDRVLSNRTK